MPSTIYAVKDKDGKTIKKPCIFPFIYQNKVHTKCVTLKKGKACATKVNSKKKIVEYGYCEDTKPMVNNANVRNNSQMPNNKKTKKLDKSSPSEKSRSIRIRKYDLDNIDNQVQQELEVLIVPDEMAKYIRPIEDKLRTLIWENPTRSNFLGWFNETFRRYRVKKLRPQMKLSCENEDECEESLPQKTKRKLFNHQKIVRQYMNMNSPYRGLIVFHGLGVGKTCSSIAIAESFKSERQIVVILMKSIKQNYISQLQECGDMYFRKENHWEFVRTTTVEKRNVALKIGIPPKVLKREGGCFLIDFTKESNYDSLTNSQKEKLQEQIMDMINSKYEFRFSNGLTVKQLEQMELTNYFDNKTIIIDEVHNLINGMASGGSYRAVKLNELFMSAKNAKFVFLSGTPMKNAPFEIAKLYNILKGPITINELTFQNSMRTGGKVDFGKLEKLMKQFPLLDQVMSTPKSKVIKVTRNPYGFIRNDAGLVKSAKNEVSHQKFMEELELFLSEKGYELKGVKTHDTTLFPDDSKKFMARFYDPIKNTINDKDTFKRRILGMTSYYSSVDPSLVPEVRTKKIISVPMSDYMFDKYADIRKTEKDREKSSSSKKGKKDNLFAVKSSYRAYSRMLCQFVFPEEIPRPFRGDLRDIEVKEEDLDKKKELEEKYEILIAKEKSREKIQILKQELKDKIQDLKNIGAEYEQRLKTALKTLETDRDKYLGYQNGNKNMLTKYSPKYARIVKELLRDRDTKKKGLKFVYTEYKTSEGVGIFSIVLRANGYTPLKVKKVDGEWELDLIKGEEHLPKYAVWQGDEESDIILSIYNDYFDKLPTKVKKQVEKLGSTNKHAEVLEILMTTKQGAEGLNTRHVRQLHVVEPYWNPVRLDQVIGRAVRIGSHLELPKSERNVDIYIYLSSATNSQLKRNINIANDFKGKTSDEVLFDIAETKRDIMNVMLKMMQESAIDCSLNLVDNQRNDPRIKCLNISSNKKDSYTYAPDIDDELKQQERDTRIKTVKQEFKTIKIPQRNMKVALLGDEIYDLDAVESGIPGRPIGKITVNSKGKKAVKFF